MGKHRETSTFITWFRSWVSGGRKLRLHMRYEDDQAPRTQPPPIEKPSVYHLLSKNDYHERDARRFVLRPTEIYSAESGQQKKIASGEDVPPSPESHISKLFKTPRPGFGV